MDIPFLNIDLVRQDPGSDDCLRACAQMVFSYFSDSISKDDIWKRLHVYKKHSGLRGGYFQDLGILALNKKYQASIYHYDWSWWDADTFEANKKSDKNLLSKLKLLKKGKNNWAEKKNINKDIKFVKAGGKFIEALPNTEIIDEFLRKRIPVLLIVDAALFYRNPKSDFMHTIIVSGKEGNDYLINDPLYAVSRIKKDELLYSWSNAKGWMMVLVPTPETHKEESNEAKIHQPQLKF